MDVEQYIRNLPWSERATDHEKALVEGNLRGFYAEMQKATQPLFDAAVAIELQIDEQTLAERDTRPPPPEPKIMGEEVEEKRCDILEEIRDAKDGYVTRSDLIAIMSDAGKQIESLRASLTRVEEERDALTKERNGMGGALPIATKHYLNALEETVKFWQPDIARMQWLSAQTVEVWTPLPAGAQRNFMAEGDADAPSNLRVLIDERIAKERG